MLRATLAAMQDEGLGQADIADLAGVNRSQVNRWARGENRPTYDKALQLARRIAPRLPRLAAKFMEASGYAWDGKPEPESPPQVIPPDLLAQIRRTIDPEDQARVIEAIRRELAGEAPAPPEEGPSSSSDRKAG